MAWCVGICDACCEIGLGISTTEQMKKKPLTTLAWLALAASLAFLSQDGAARCGLSTLLSWGFAIGLTVSASILVHAFRETGKWLYAGLAAASIVLLAGMDSMSFRGIIAESNQAPVVVAESVREMRQANVDALRKQEAVHQAMLADAMSKAEAEKMGGNGKPGEGPAWIQALSFARGQQSSLQGIQGQLEKALLDLEASAGEASALVVKRHPLSDVGPWPIFGGFALLEIILAGIAWGLGESSPRKLVAEPNGVSVNISNVMPAQALSPVQQQDPEPDMSSIFGDDAISPEIARKASAIHSKFRRQQARGKVLNS